jgi:hypothetical protein
MVAFYAQHHLALELSIILYGIVVVWGHTNLRWIMQQLESFIVDYAREYSNGQTCELVFRRLTQEWHEQYGERTFLIPSRRDFWVTRVKGADLIRILGICPAYVEVALSEHLGQTDLVTLGPEGHKAWETYRHQLRIGIRSTAPHIRQVSVRFARP